MGKGDKKSRKGKLWRGTYGNKRRRKDNKPKGKREPK
ncbi:30S ribosomal protein THX [Telluribacter humicola]|nr:30S ribosomal protein THX [Telluribacter humicola]